MQIQVFLKVFSTETSCITIDDELTYKEFKQIVSDIIKLDVHLFQITKVGTFLEVSYDSNTRLANMDIRNDTSLFVREKLNPYSFIPTSYISG
jgi:hypothetical protein